MVEEAAKALVPGPVATTALATLLVADPQLRAALASGERTAGVALDGDVDFDDATSRATGSVPWVLGASDTVRDGLLLVPAGEKWLLVEGASMPDLRSCADLGAGHCAGHRRGPGGKPGRDGAVR